ncbi:NADP-dependent malic enzyme [Klebsiella pneumoniae]|uniref:NADP-dependent malic enzyme n=1 Tax=Klebsiella pneumoniae TaxID=573 RepID=A0A2X3GVZ8_KLEPN|nr:NADP-dependent malic enzyme [Klebsiella pneumoniae]
MWRRARSPILTPISRSWSEFVYKTNLFMKPIFSQARKEPKRVVLAEGEETRVLHGHPGAGVSGTGQTDSGGAPERD